MELALIAALLISGEEHAAKQAGKAYFKQQGYDVQLKQLEQRHIDEDTKKLLGYGSAIARVAIEHRLTLRWTFP